jgi:hypothetical protein
VQIDIDQDDLAAGAARINADAAIAAKVCTFTLEAI